MTNFAQDMAVKQAWGLTLTEWNRASEKARAYYRDNITHTEHFQENQ